MKTEFGLWLFWASLRHWDKGSQQRSLCCGWNPAEDVLAGTWSNKHIQRSNSVILEKDAAWFPLSDWKPYWQRQIRTEEKNTVLSCLQLCFIFPHGQITPTEKSARKKCCIRMTLGLILWIGLFCLTLSASLQDLGRISPSLHYFPQNNKVSLSITTHWWLWRNSYFFHIFTTCQQQFLHFQNVHSWLLKMHS